MVSDGCSGGGLKIGVYYDLSPLMASGDGELRATEQSGVARTEEESWSCFYMHPLVREPLATLAFLPGPTHQASELFSDQI